MFRIGKTFKFDAAHKLEGLPEGHKCGELHGHTYSVTVELASHATMPEGWVFDYGEMAVIKKYLDEQLDHKYLNILGEIRFQPTAENLAAFLFDKARMLLELPENVFVSKVIVKETDSTYAEYSLTQMPRI